MTDSENIREKSLEWFYSKTYEEKIDLKDKYFPESYIAFSSQWGFHFTFGQIEEMYRRDITNSDKSV